MKLDQESKSRLLLLICQHWQGRYLRRSLQGLSQASDFFQLSASQQRERLGDKAYPLFQAYQEHGEQSDLWRQLEHTLQRCEALSVDLIFAHHQTFPSLLLATADQPELLFVQGDTSVLHWPQLAIVGSRNASASGIKQAGQIAQELSQAGLAITSGLALGIDSAAHRGSLAGGGRTIAVLGSGLDELYPKRNRGLSEEILAAGGALVSEYPFGMAPLAANFPKRNRIVTGLALGTLVVEAAERSGSLISARLALEENRDVFAVPGSINNPLSRGCHALIKQGAILVEGAKDIAEHLSGAIQGQLDFSAPPPVDTVPNDEPGLLKHIGYDPLSIDEIQLSCGLSIEVITVQLMELELNGQISQQAGLYQRL